MKKLSALIFTAILFLNTGCRKWLELEPKSEVSSDVLLSTPEGFSIALNGIYTNLSSDPLYGGELAFNLVDVLGRVYETKNTLYDGLKNYDYVSNDMDKKINGIWALAYSTIANCNGLLEEMNKKGDGFFKPEERARLEGELLSIRAMLHFDLLRLFAPAPIVKDVAAIPYYATLSNAPMPEKLTSEILQSVIADLERSKALQKTFDTKPDAKEYFHKDFRFEFNNHRDPSFFGSSKRGFHMGYYATTAMLARVALYAGNNRLALDNARQVIDDKMPGNEPVITFTSGTNIDVGEYNRLLSQDLLFALYRIDYEEGFNNVAFLLPNTSQIFGADLNSDYRKKCYLTPDGKQLLKYKTDQGDKREKDVKSRIPVIRLSELYHIAAETLYDTDPNGALDLLNTLRTKRGCTIPLSPFPTKTAFIDAIINDARREFAGEGKLFFMYKRLNKTIPDEANGNQTLTDKFILPVTER
jgi:starch-binding outer membrane protein, SusD/RagB family